jgi:lysozyme
MIEGIDVSDWQGNVDWTAHAEENIAFGFARAIDGDGTVDLSFQHNWVSMGRNGFVRGAYHVGRPSVDAAVQVRQFLESVRLAPGDLFALELKVSDGLPPNEVAGFARRWCAEATRRTGALPFVWTYEHFAVEGNCEGLEEYPLWIAAPGRRMGAPAVPPPWSSWAIHQYANSPVNLDVFPGSTADLLALGVRG